MPRRIHAYRHGIPCGGVFYCLGHIIHRNRKRGLSAFLMEIGRRVRPERLFFPEEMPACGKVSV